MIGNWTPKLLSGRSSSGQQHGCIKHNWHHPLLITVFSDAEQSTCSRTLHEQQSCVEVRTQDLRSVGGWWTYPLLLSHMHHCPPGAQNLRTDMQCLSLSHVRQPKIEVMGNWTKKLLSSHSSSDQQSLGMLSMADTLWKSHLATVCQQRSMMTIQKKKMVFTCRCKRNQKWG